MPQFWKAAQNGFRVRFAGEKGAGESDLVFLDEKPFAVLEWSEAGAATVTVELDPAKLKPADPSGRIFDYAEGLRDPR